MLGLTDVLWSFGEKAFYLPQEADRFHNVLTSSIDFKVTKTFSFGVAYKDGEDAPKFKGVRRIELTFGVGFGGE